MIDYLNTNFRLYEKTVPEALLPPASNFLRDLPRGFSDTGDACILNSSIEAALKTEKQITKLYNNDQISKKNYEIYSNWSTGLLLNNPMSSFNFGLNVNGLHYNPIGAFYESRTQYRTPPPPSPKKL